MIMIIIIIFNDIIIIVQLRYLGLLIIMRSPIKVNGMEDGIMQSDEINYKQLMCAKKMMMDTGAGVLTTDQSDG